MFNRLDFLYLPGRDVAAELEHYTAGLGRGLVFAIEAVEARVVMVRAASEGPRLLPAEHLEGDRPILVFRVEDLDGAIAELRERGVELGASFGMPYGHGIEVSAPGPQRLALYELTRPVAEWHLAGRRDF